MGYHDLMRTRYLTFAFSTLAIAGLGLGASAEQKPAAVARTSSTSPVVVYKSPT